jgi:hypothetical protein
MARERKEREDTDTRVFDAFRVTPSDISDEERANILRDEALNNALPNPPKMPGWHLAWLSTTNQYTPIQWYMRLGYVPVTKEEMPEMGHLKAHSAEMAGFVSVNEMVLFKIPEDAYQQIMREFHHNRPNEEEGRLRENLEKIKAEVGEDRRGKSLVLEESATKELGERTARFRGGFE